MTLVEFLLARIHEDSEWARLAQDSSDRAPWHQASGPFKTKVNTHAGLGIAEARSSNVARFVAMHDPVRVLAECEAKRAIVGMHSDGGYDTACHVDGYGLTAPDDCPTLRALATIYADHPDYRDEWRP